LDWDWGWNMFPKLLLLQDRLGWMVEGKFDELERIWLGGDWGMTMLHDPSYEWRDALVCSTIQHKGQRYDAIRLPAMPEGEEDLNETNEYD
jgi:hypothetical protein